MTINLVSLFLEDNLKYYLFFLVFFFNSFQVLRYRFHLSSRRASFIYLYPIGFKWNVVFNCFFVENKISMNGKKISNETLLEEKWEIKIKKKIITFVYVCFLDLLNCSLFCALIHPKMFQTLSFFSWSKLSSSSSSSSLNRYFDLT